MEQSGGRLYRAFVLRWWPEAQTTPEEPAVWRFTLEKVGPPHTRRAFGTIEALMAFVQTEWQSSDVPTDTDHAGDTPC